MCIVALAWHVISQQPLVLLSNRDEFYQRPTSALHFWQDEHVVAGQDLQSGGTWMGVTSSGRWAVLTNIRDGTENRTYQTSRGSLITDFLKSNIAPIRFARQLEVQQQHYAGFNLFVGDQSQAVYMSNRGEAPQILAKGVYVVSNGLMSEHWEKTAHLRKRFTQEFLPMLQANVSTEDIENNAWDILQDERQVIAALLPQTGIRPEMEKLLSSIFIQSPNYGTRCSNFLTMTHTHWHWLEKTQWGTKTGQITAIDRALTK